MSEQMKKLQQRFFQVWKNRDPWTYRSRETTPAEIEMRKEELWKLIRASDRYQQLWPTFMGDIGDRIQDKYGFEILDSDILRMLADEKDGITITTHVSKNWLPAQGQAWHGFAAC